MSNVVKQNINMTLADANLVSSRARGENITADDPDEVDTLPTNPIFTYLDFLGGIGAVIAFYFDVVTDIILMWVYFGDKRYIYFGLTMILVVLPSLLTNIVSLKWYWIDDNNLGIPKVSSSMHNLRIIFHLLLMGPMWRSIESLYFGCKSRCNNSELSKRYYKYMIDIDTRISLLKMFEAFTESAPQLILQLYILISEAQVFRQNIETGFFLNFHNGKNRYLPKHEGQSSKLTPANTTFKLEGSNAAIIFQALSISSALISLSLSLTFYARNRRYNQNYKKNMSILGFIFFFFWHLLTVGARVLALSLFASVFIIWFPFVLTLRWIIMLAWIISLQADLSESMCLQHCFEVVYSLVYLFTYIKVKDEFTRRKYLFYYTYEVIEDGILVAFWAWFIDPMATNFYMCALFSHFGGVLLGLTCMFVYYAQLHPNGSRKDLDIVFFTLLLSPSEVMKQTMQVNEIHKRKVPTFV